MGNVMRHLWIIGLVLLPGLFCTIRDDNGNPAISGPNSPLVNTGDNSSVTPSIFASPESAYVKMGDTLSIRVRILGDTSVADSLWPLSGLQITASASKGSLIDDTLTSDINGRATLLFTDKNSGRVELTVRCSGVQQTVRFEVTDTPDKIQKLIEAVPDKPAIKADGQDFTYISVRVLNENHNPISGECVQFVSTSGIIAGEDNCGGSGQSITSKEGIARAKLISSNINDTAFVTAFLVSDQSMSDETEVAFSGVSISIISDQTNISIGDTSIITAQILNASNVPVSRTPVFFSLKDGSSSNLRLIKADSVTNYEGRAVARFRATSNGYDQVNIRSAGTESSVQINVSSLSISLSLNKSVVQTQETDSAVLTSTFVNGSGTPLSGKNIVLTRYYKTEAGNDTSDSFSGKTGSNGKCSFYIRAISYEGTMRLEVIGFDKTEGYASGDTSVQFITTRVMTIRSPESIAADGVSRSAVTVLVKNRSGNPIVGDEVLFSTTAGMITAKATTDSDGKAVAFLTSDRRNMTAKITAVLSSDPAKKQSALVEFTGVELTTGAEPPSISSNGKDTSIISMSLIDAAGNPIAGEPVNFSKQLDKTVIASADSVTNNRGEASCMIYGTGSGMDTIRISSAGANGYVVLNYSSNVIVIDTAAGQRCIADSTDSTLINVTYLQGNRTTPVTGAEVQVSITIGKLDTLFAKKFTTNSKGRISFYMNNPHFASTAVIYVQARTSSEVTTASYPLYFKANLVKKIIIAGTPEVININGNRARLTATAFDSLGNRVKDARLSFNIVSGPSGGEYLDPPVAVTGDDGSAYTYLVSGKTPSYYRQVWVVAGNFSAVKSDTVKFTFAGPPKNITIRTNILKGKNPNDGTFILPCAAIVTDVNGNPVADGTEVNFSLQVSGYVSKKIYPVWEEAAGVSTIVCNYTIDTSYCLLPFEDFNNNFHLDQGEDRNGDGLPNRGEDINGDGIYIPSPPFEDINGDGIRQRNLLIPVEEKKDCHGNSRFADLNRNGFWDRIEPLASNEYFEVYNRLLADSAFWRYPVINPEDSADFKTLMQLETEYEQLNGYISEARSFDADVDKNGVVDPNTAVSIQRTVTTSGGKALNEILYGQSDATRIEVMIWAESQGVVTETPEQLILPVVKGE
ncbi:MAG: hypothetical protein GX556_15170 [Fibrobacter sp.]|nr:hypothetical protein [Fibrobacter sp.]